MTRIISLLLACAAMTGCAVKLDIPPEHAFTPKKVIDTTTITWVAADDPTTECKRRFPNRMAWHPIVPACAGWDFQRHTCTIVTGTTTTHQILGHEVRHCFEGAFHQ